MTEAKVAPVVWQLNVYYRLGPNGPSRYCLTIKEGSDPVELAELGREILRLKLAAEIQIRPTTYGNTDEGLLASWLQLAVHALNKGVLLD